MQQWDVLFWIGVILMILGVVFLAFKPPEQAKISVKVPRWAEIEINTPAFAIILLGAGLALVSLIWRPSSSPQPEPTGPVATEPPETPKTPDITKPPGASAAREEREEEEKFKSADYDADKLKPLAASSIPSVQKEASGRLAEIEKEEEQLKSAHYNADKLKLLAASPIPAVQKEASGRLAEIEKEEEKLNSAEYDKSRLTDLATRAYSLEVRAVASDRLKVLETEEGSLKSADYERTKLMPLASRAHSPEVRAEADNRLNMLGEIRSRLYELNFNPDPDLRNAILDFEKTNKMVETGTPTEALLKRLREARADKPWGAIVYREGEERVWWGMSYGHDTRQAALASARADCHSPEGCPKEISFYDSQCGALAHGAFTPSDSRWALHESNSIQQAKKKALSDCRKRGSSCSITAQVCADGSEFYERKK